MSQPTNFIDLSGVFQAQKNYLTGLSVNSNDATLNSKVQTLQSQLDQINTNFTNSNASSSQVLDHQQKMIDIVDTEKTRLLQKKQNVDTALESRKRAALLNESYRQRYYQYIRIIIVVIVTLAVYVALVFLSRAFSFIPSFIFDILYVIIFAVGFFVCYFIYLEINSRDKMYFDQIDLDGPSILSPDQISKQKADAGKSGNLLGSINLNGCIGNDCCSTGTVWDVSGGVCVVESDIQKAVSSAAAAATSAAAAASKSGFTTISAINNISGSVKPNYPNEFKDYVLV
jgi:hypothetical protein